MLHKSHKFQALLMAGAMLLSLNSCGLLEMRDCYVETEEAEDTAERMLAPAQRVNQVIQRPESEETSAAPAAEEAKDVTVVLTGDILIDSGIVKDAAEGAYDGQSYSFLTMYTGLYSCIHDADLAMMSYSTAEYLADRSEQNPPVESAAALSDLGVDLLDTTGCSDMEASMEKQGIASISAADDTFELVERNGITFAFLSADSVSEAVLENLESAALMSDIAVVSVTWDENTASADMTSAVWTLAAAGADVIVGKGAGLGNVEWLDTGDGTRTLAAYSLGNILATSDETTDVLSFTVTDTPNGKAIGDVRLEPTFTHYTAEYRDYQVFRLGVYSDELAANHANSGVYTAVLADAVRSTVSAEFLPAAYRG